MTPDVGDRFAATVSLDLQRLDAVLEVDPVSRAAHVQAGILGPALARALEPHGLALRHYPQSYEFSTLGGWIATRAGGHYATGPTSTSRILSKPSRCCHRPVNGRPAAFPHPAPDPIRCAS